MTIAAGVWCSDGIILCADTEVTEGDTKFQQRKVWNAGDHLMLTGCGATAHMKMAFDKLAHKFSELRPEHSEAARVVVEDLIFGIYEQHIFPFIQAGHPHGNSLDIWLIVALRCANGELALIRTSQTAASLVENYEAVGAGGTIFKYWARYFLDGNFSMDLASYFAMFILREAKNVAFGVGGSTHVFKMPKDTSVPRTRRAIWDEKSILAAFPSSAVDEAFAAMERLANQLPASTNEPEQQPGQSDDAARE